MTETRRKWIEKNKDRLSAYRKEWRKNHPENVRKWNRNRYAKVGKHKITDDVFKPEDWEESRKRACSVCGILLKKHERVQRKCSQCS